MNPNVTIERRKTECTALPKGWQREEVLRKTGLSAGKIDVYYYSRGMRTDISLVPPIRQTASIFKQPVTVVKNQEGGKVKHDSKHGQEKPKQLFWEKRLEGLRACNVAGEEFENIELPKNIKAVGPNIYQQTVLQSIATSLHVSNQPVTGQTVNLQILLSNSGAYLNPEQPLMQSLNVTDDDIRRQEDRVGAARRRLQEALKG